MWCHRRLLRISWTQHKTNEWILRELEVERELLGRVKSLKLSYYGHTTRKYESLEKELIHSRDEHQETAVVVDNRALHYSASRGKTGIIYAVYSHAHIPVP